MVEIERSGAAVFEAPRAMIERRRRTSDMSKSIPTPDEYQLCPETGAVKVPLSSWAYPGHFALIDPCDVDLVSAYRWNPVLYTGGFYARSVILDGNTAVGSIAMHRLILGVTDPDIQVDHINRDPLDNRRSNLRLCTAAQNRCNRGKQRGNATSKYKGVFWDRSRGKWCATIRFEGKTHRLGRFDDELDAALAYDTAARQIHGEFAYLNFPDKRND